MKQFGEGSLRKLAMDVPTESIFHFEGEDYKEKRKVSNTWYPCDVCCNGLSLFIQFSLAFIAH